MLLYIHGFASSGQSYKGKVLTIAFGRQQVLAPTLSTVPDEAVAALKQTMDPLLEQNTPFMLVGSSLGGYYAAYLAGEYDLPCVLVNPSVSPLKTLVKGLGLNPYYSGKSGYFLFTRDHLGQFRNYQPSERAQERMLLMVQTGDEVLDYRKALEQFPKAEHYVIEGGSHGFDRFEDHLHRLRVFYRQQLGEELLPQPTH